MNIVNKTLGVLIVLIAAIALVSFLVGALNCRGCSIQPAQSLARACPSPHPRCTWEVVRQTPIVIPATKVPISTTTPTSTYTSTPTPSATPTDTVVATPYPTPDLARNRAAYWPAMIFTGIGEQFTITVFVRAEYDTQAIESRIFYNPVVLDFIALRTGDVACDAPRGLYVRPQPGFVRYDCESVQAWHGDVRLAEIVFAGRYTGTCPIQGNLFVAKENGFGYMEHVAPAQAVVR